MSFFQGGVELMNKPGLQGDKEVMTMVQESLPGISLKKYSFGIRFC